MSRRKARKTRKEHARRLSVRERRQKNREDRRIERAMLKLAGTMESGETDMRTIKGLEQSGPVPPRNGPCPLHPQFKAKHCPHGCLSLFERHRSRVAGDVVVVPVADGATRLLAKDKSGLEVRQKLAGNIGVEDAVSATVHDLNLATEDL